MHGHQYVWLIWSSAFLGSFLIVFAFSPQHRVKMLAAGAATTPFGLTEPLFVPDYWNPPSLFDLAQRTGFDLESLIFAFSIGGLAVVLYDRLTGRASMRLPAPAHGDPRHRLHGLALLVPGILFLLLSAFGWNPIYPAILAMSGGAAASVLCRPDLLRGTLAGGLLFLGCYALFMSGLTLSFPSYVEQVWNLVSLSGLRPLGIPAEELLFGLAFGLYWSSAYEHLTWRARSAPAGEPAREGAEPRRKS